ncbi:MAG: hypothetical protein QOH59_2625 [Gemmatimonadales bacterium]|jgi:hypothetical protein|nr:hypothetical protein [Gemmatimonadales bacterium]
MRVSPQRGLILSLLAAGALLSATPKLSTPLQAQAPASKAQPSLVLQAGQSYLDVDGIVGAVRAEFPLDRGGRWLLIPGVTYAHYTLGSPSPQVDFFAPEALVHLQLGQGRIRPYVGGGAGLVLINMLHTFDPVLSVGTGLRADLTPTLGARLELDARAFGVFKAGSVGWNLGLAQRF